MSAQMFRGQPEQSRYTPGEPVFVPPPNGADHLEGVIVSVVLDGKRGRSFLLVLDAQSFEEVGRAFAPHVIPFGFHGEFKGNSCP
jgi:beta,beta-carotene 9',10'-dioxygenase